MRESAIQASILHYLTILEKQGRLSFIRNNSFSGSIQRRNGSQGYIKNAKRGAPDIIVFLPNGYYVLLEVKSDTGKQSQEQKDYQTLLQKLGGMYHIVRSLDEVEVVLQAYRV